ncbi:MAG: HD domain-containing protein [Planctomycetota bacterium]|nr:HD domain-containing protein [Planctomycetota bacterium]
MKHGDDGARLGRAGALALLDRNSPAGESWPLHCRQVAKIARRLADAVGFGSEEAELIEAQALLHDIGRSKTHGPLHGWTGFVLVRAHGYPREARGCLTHWLKGRAPEELEGAGRLTPGFVARAYAAFDAEPWGLADSIMSLADSCVMNTTIVSLDQRHEDLLKRYGESRWMRRAWELARQHADEVAAALGSRVEDLLAPLHGDRLDPR